MPSLHCERTDDFAGTYTYSRLTFLWCRAHSYDNWRHRPRRSPWSAHSEQGLPCSYCGRQLRDLLRIQSGSLNSFFSSFSPFVSCFVFHFVHLVRCLWSVPSLDATTHIATNPAVTSTWFRISDPGIFIDANDYPTATEFRACVAFTDNGQGGGGSFGFLGVRPRVSGIEWFGSLAHTQTQHTGTHTHTPHHIRVPDFQEANADNLSNALLLQNEKTTETSSMASCICTLDTTCLLD